MKSLVLLAAALAVFNVGCQPMPTNTPDTYTLTNGLRVLVREDHFAPVVALQVWVNAGGADESDEEAGVAHVHEHMLFKGTARRGLGDIARTVEGAGGRINAWTSWDQTVYHIVLASRHAELGLDVLADAVRNSSFDKDELEKELRVVMEEWRRGQDRPGSRLFHSLFDTAFDLHPYRRPVIGTEESINGLSREKILDFYARHYAPNNMTLVVVGDVETTEIKETVDRLFGDFERRQRDTVVRPAEPEQTGVRFESGRMDVEEAHLGLGFHIPSASHADAAALDLLSFVLGGGESSRLYRRLVADEELATDTGTFAYTPPDPGIFVVTASLEADRIQDSYAAIIEEIARVSQQPPSQEELDRARLNLESDFIFRRETVQGQARELGYALTTHNDPNYDRVYIERLAMATPETLRDLAATYLRRDNMSVVTVLPQQAAAQLSLETVTTGAEAIAGPAPAINAQKSDNGWPKAQATTAADSPEPQGQPKLIRLANGVRLIVHEHHEVPVFSVRAAVRAGVLAETDATNGISNFTAEMLTRGTHKLDRRGFAAAVESLAGSVGGFSGRNSMGLAGAFLSERFDQGMTLFLESLLEPAFSPQEVEKARRELLLAIKHRNDNSSRVAFDMAFAQVYPDHPYGMTTLGQEQSVAAISRDDLVSFYKDMLDPGNLVITVVGDIDEEAVVETIEAALAGLKPSRRPFELPAPATPPTSVRQIRHTTSRHQSHIVLAYPSVDVLDPDRYPLAVLDMILSGQSGRLFDQLRDRQSLAYSVSAFVTKGLTPGVLGAYIGTDPANTEAALAGLLGQLEDIGSQEPTAAEMERAKRYLIGSQEIGLQSNSAMAEDMTFNELYGLGYLASRDYPERINAVTAAEVVRVASKYFDPAIRAEVVVGPQDDAD